MTLPEIILWQALRARPGGLRFRRQHPAGPYVLDFYCPTQMFAIEVYGEAHGLGDRPARDGRRDAWLAGRDVVVLRIRAADVMSDLDAVLSHVLATAARLPPLHRPAAGPPPLAGEECA